MNSFIQTGLSIAKIAIKSSFSLPKSANLPNKLAIVGNGPSASLFIENQLSKSESDRVPLFCINGMGATENFKQLKPSFYLCLDHAWYNFNEENFNNPETHFRCKTDPGFASIQEMINNTWKSIFEANWEITLFIPQVYRNTFIVNKINHSHLKIQFFNYTVVKGFTWFENWAYSMKLGSPQCENVINSCIVNAINFGAKEIYLTGIDHTFHRNIIVDDNNVLQVQESHFYGDSPKRHPLIHSAGKQKNTPVKLHEFFKSQTRLHLSYSRLQQFAKYKGVKIFNSAPGSYVDEFERFYFN